MAPLGSGSRQSRLFTGRGHRATLGGMSNRVDQAPTGRAAAPVEWQSLKGRLPEPRLEEERTDLLWQELVAVFAWYDKAATRNRLGYQILKLTALTAGAVVTVLAAISAPAALTASLAGIIVVLEGAQQMFQFHPNWISYRGTAETLRHQAFLYVAEVSPFDDPENRRERLAGSLRDATIKESAMWADTMRTGSRSDGQPP
jgi:hypothetical protein